MSIVSLNTQTHFTLIFYHRNDTHLMMRNADGDRQDVPFRGLKHQHHHHYHQDHQDQGATSHESQSNGHHHIAVLALSNIKGAPPPNKL